MPSPAVDNAPTDASSASSSSLSQLPLDYYAILKLKRSATSDEIASAYRSLSIKSHPDRQSSSSSTNSRQFALISEAFDVLSQPRWRALYDEQGEFGIKGHSSSLAQAKRGLGAGELYSYTADPITQFERFHGQSSAINKPQPSTTSSSSSSNQQVAPILVNLYVSLEELLTGVSRKHKLHLQRLKSSLNKAQTSTSSSATASSTDASETVSVEQILTVDIGAGWRDGTKITFAHLGDEALQSGGDETGNPSSTVRGPVIFTLRVKPHPLYTRSSDDIVHTMNMSLLQALTGAHAELKLLDGHELLVSTEDLIASPQNEKVIKGAGLPKLNKNAKSSTAAQPQQQQQRGNLIIKFNIRFPESLSLEQKKALTQILPK